jgi:hypothetical protein
MAMKVKHLRMIERSSQVLQVEDTNGASLIDEWGDVKRTVGERDRYRLDLIIRTDRSSRWENDGFDDYPSWIGQKWDISPWKARRMIYAAYALEELPVTAAALASGTLGLDKVVELSRFATPETERGLIKWAQRVTPRAIRKRADKNGKPDTDEALQALKDRYVRFNERLDGCMEIEAVVPLADGIKIEKALKRAADTLPDEPKDENGDGPGEERSREMRMADALGMWAANAIATDANPDLATVVMHLDLKALKNGTYGTTLENVGIHPETAERLACECRYQVLWTGKDGDIGLNRMTRNVRQPLRRLVIARDEGTCFFPGCDHTQFLEVHHIVHWVRNGQTNLGNLVLVCPTHHRLLHEGCWSMVMGRDGEPIVFRPSGRRYIPDLPGTELNEELIEKEMSRAGPAPGSLEGRYGIKNFQFKETVAGLVDELYEVAKHLVDD